MHFEKWEVLGNFGKADRMAEVTDWRGVARMGCIDLYHFVSGARDFVDKSGAGGGGMRELLPPFLFCSVSQPPD